MPEKESALAVKHFVKTYDLPRYLSLSPESILECFKLAEELKQDVYDCLYVAFALQEKEAGIVTMNTDFERLCRQTGLRYVNPVPKEVLKRFRGQNR